jgi:hypothetical protein
MPTNFDLAPPAKTVDGLLAVPMDIQTIAATLTFDGATSSGTGDATIAFIAGPVDGRPIFDLRQTITAAWLDGVPIAVGLLAHHDFGGGANAKLRVVDSVLTAGSAHTLRVTYNVGLPDASPAGSYLPGLTWSAGPRLALNFGFTDLGAGRYLEAWIPANLIYDQFELTLTLQILNTAVEHAVITNGTVTPLGTNHWSIAFPARFTALSTLLELRAADTVTHMSDTTTLPVSGTVVTIEVWKLVTSGADLATQIDRLKTFLADNETSSGPYLHGSRFVAFINVGGMEYEGGTTSGTGALRHETFHSWFARGLKPAGQPDGWWDEAWTTYNDNGATGAAAFNFSDAPVELCPRNPWIRITANGAYTAGNRFFEGAASAVGVANLKSLMSAFCNERRSRPVTTAHLEEFLVSRSGRAELVDGFHRFIYGVADPSPLPDLWLRDDPGDPGADAWGGHFWNSPDLWIRNEDDGGATHQPPIYGRDNWFYARVRNRSASATARHFLVTFNVKTYAGTEFVYPADFLPCIAAAAGFDLTAGSSTVVKARWPAALVPPEGTHACWLAAVLARLDHPVAGRHVWEHNNLAQKNLTIVTLDAGDWMILPLVLTNATRRLTRSVVEIVRPEDRPQLNVALLHNSERFFDLSRKAGAKISPFEELFDRQQAVETIPTDCGAGALRIGETSDRILTSRQPAARALIHFVESFAALFEEGFRSHLPIALRGNDQRTVGLYVRVPEDARSGEVIRMDLVQRAAPGRRVVGGIAVEVRVR